MENFKKELDKYNITMQEMIEFLNTIQNHSSREFLSKKIERIQLAVSHMKDAYEELEDIYGDDLK